MDWYYGCGTNDFVVPGDQEVLPSPENWSKWGINAPEGYNSPKKFMTMDSNTTKLEFNFNGKSFGTGVKFESSSYDKDQSSSSSVSCGGLADQSFQQTSLLSRHHHQTNYQLQELSSSFEQTDDIFLDSILEDYPCAENLNKSFYFYPENQCNNTQGGLQKDIEASEFLTCNSNSDDCFNIETLNNLDPTEQFSIDEAMHNHSSIEESTLQNLEAIISQFNDKTRISFRDALYRLARDTKQQHVVEDLDGDVNMHEAMSWTVQNEALRSDNKQPMESETNRVDRAVANLMFNGTTYCEC